jgi:hypothetical protein
MPSTILCDDGHEWGGSKRTAAIELAKTGALAKCECGAAKHWYLDHYYPNWDAQAKHEVVHVERLWDDKAADEELYDPMLFVIRNSKDGHYALLSQYWVNVEGSWKYGQYSPQLRWKELDALVKKIPAKYHE